MKKILKVFFIMLLVFLVFLYCLGSCSSSSSEYDSFGDDKVIHEVTPEEYEKEIQELIDGQASFDFGLTAYAEDKSNLELIKDYYKNSELFDKENWEIGKKEIMQLFTKDNNAFKSVKDDTGESYVKVPYTYEMYGKNLVIYKGGTWENVEIWISTTSAVSDGSKTGTIRIRRTNQNYSYTTFNFDISVSTINLTFGNDKAFLIKFVGISSNVSGCTSEFIDDYLTNSHIVSFSLSSVNKVKTYSPSFSTALTSEKFIFNTYNADYYTPNGYTLSSLVTNDYEFSQSINNYVSANKCIKPVNLYYNNNANSIVNNNNVNNYNDYIYNSETNTIDFDTNAFISYFDTELTARFDSLFNDIFSRFPDIGVDISTDDDINYNNLIDIINQLTTSTTTTTTTETTGTYPIVTTGGGGCDCDIYVTVDITFPEEFYRTYPTLTTEPAISIDKPDLDFVLDSELPVDALSSASSLVNLAYDFFDSVGLTPILVMGIALGLVAMFFL